VERVVENLNRGLLTAFANDPDLYLLGEDVADPYGGAFKATKGLSTAYPDRTISTPISEGALVGVANGLALSGNKAIAEIMFSDFVTLAFDQIVNFAAKSVSMYGRRVPMPVVVRCPTGGQRGYGPTHSQSLQKHFFGVPDLSVHEISPFHDNTTLLASLLAQGKPALLFEDKVLYAQQMFADGVVDELLAYDFPYGADGPAVAQVRDTDRPEAVVIAPGGVARRALAAAGSLLREAEISCAVVVPTQLYPFDVAPLLPLLRTAEVLCVVEDSAAGSTWGTEVANEVHTSMWGELKRPVVLCNAASTIVPSAAHLERRVLPQTQDIHLAIVEALDA
jgi:pyruvate dehydrogenase E1 component beta subunit